MGFILSYPFCTPFTVIAALLYLPFEKFFHIFQRPAQLGVKLYQLAGEEGPAVRCKRCGEAFASLQHIEDLKQVLPQVGFDYSMNTTERIWQELCPPSKRSTRRRAWKFIRVWQRVWASSQMIGLR